jgi:thiol:disulfide interchange protein DsbA
MRLIQILMFALAVCGLNGAAYASPAAPKNGVEYDTLAETQGTRAGDKVDVIEFFSYTCPHCNAFEPALSAWVKQNADKITFKRVHVAFRPSDEPLQRMYLSLETMGLADQYHAKVFAAIHDERLTRLSDDEQVFSWLEKNGLERAKFIGVYRSFGAQSWISRAKATIQAHKIDQWPMLAIGGRYMTSPFFASRGMAQVEEVQQQRNGLQVMDFLVAKAKSEMK